MEAFRNWYVRNQDAITWFIIGFLTFGLFVNLSEGDYVWAAVDALLIWVNYKLASVRLQ